MSDYLFTLGLLAVPLLIYRVRTPRRGLLTGLFLSLYFFGKADALLLSAPLSAAVFLYVRGKEEERAETAAMAAVSGRSADAKRAVRTGKTVVSETAINARTTGKNQLYVLNPAASMLVLFATAMIVFCAFGDAFYRYGAYLMLNEKALVVSRQLSFAACLLGPLITGNWCDRKGPFSAAIGLTLLAEISVLLASAADASLLLFVFGSFLVSLCISGFFVLLPLIASAFFGAANFLRFYPVICGFAMIFFSMARYQYTSSWALSANPGGFLMSLSLLTFISACFIYAAWKRRFVLVEPSPVRGQKAQ